MFQLWLEEVSAFSRRSVKKGGLKQAYLKKRVVKKHVFSRNEA